MIKELVWLSDTYNEEPTVSEYGPVSKNRRLKLIASASNGCCVLLHAGQQYILNKGSRKWREIVLWEWVCVGSIYADAKLAMDNYQQYVLVKGLASGDITGAFADTVARELQACILHFPDTWDRLEEICPTLVAACRERMEVQDERDGMLTYRLSSSMMMIGRDNLDEITAGDLREEASTALDQGEDVELYRVYTYDAEGYQQQGHGELLWIRGARRAGITYMSDADWTDAETPSHALQLWADDAMVN